jgi:hypothetical protein
MHRLTDWALWSLAALALTACVQVEVRTTINPNGSGSLALAYGLNTLWLESAGQQLPPEEFFTEFERDHRPSALDDLYLLEGVEVTTETVREGNVQWYVQHFSLPDLSQLDSVFGERVRFTFDRQTGILADTYRYRWRSPTMAADFLGLSPQELAEYQELSQADPTTAALAQLAEFKLRWTLQMPGEVVSHNADEYDQKTGTLTWRIDPATADEWDFQAESRVVKTYWPGVMAVFGLMVLTGAGLVGLALIKLLAKRQQTAT